MEFFVLFIYTFYVFTKFSNAIHFETDVFLNTSELIRSMGYPAEDHDIYTEDGYIISVQRIPPRKPGHPVVFLQHGLLDSSSTWVVNFPNQSLAFVLFDAGFDVWLGNNRGNTYGLRHVKLNASQEEFWNFSWDEISNYDLVSMVNYVLKKTNQESLFYVGHSQGSLISFAQLSKNHEFASKIRLFVALGPVATASHIESPIRLLADLGRLDDETYLYHLFGKKEFLPTTEMIRWLGSKCNLPVLGREICENVIFVLCGPSEFFNLTRLPIYLDHTPAGTSVKNMVHFSQMVISGKFEMYDYGCANDNKKHYNQTSPPEYDLGRVNVPVALYWAQNDWLADPIDVQYLKKKLPNIVDELNIKFYNHLDFVWAINAKSVLYDRMIKLMLKF